MTKTLTSLLKSSKWCLTLSSDICGYCGAANSFRLNMNQNPQHTLIERDYPPPD